MTVVVFGIDALDPAIVDPDVHPNLVLEEHAPIETIVSASDEPSTHELWPTIITGLPPAGHGLELDDGVAWGNPVLRYASLVADLALPDALQTRIGAWLLNNTEEDAFRAPATYYEERDIETVFDGRESKAIGVPNYVTAPDDEDREHVLRRSMGALFERDPELESGHRSADPVAFYERCMEMTMVRTMLVRRAYRSKSFELVFGYTSGLDLIGHVSYDLPGLQQRAYAELDDFVGELLADLSAEDELVLVSDHGLQDGVHTKEAMIASTDEDLVDDVDSVTDVRAAIEAEFDTGGHTPDPPSYERRGSRDGVHVRDQLEDLGYM